MTDQGEVVSTSEGHPSVFSVIVVVITTGVEMRIKVAS